MSQIAFFINPTIRNYHKIKSHIENSFKGYEYQFFVSQYSGHFLQLPSEALQEGYKHFISVGGDGTLNETVNGILKACENDAHLLQNIRVGIIPTGSGNDFIRNLGYQTIKELKMLIQNDECIKVDVGHSAYINRNHQPEERYFINVADVGIGGEVVLAKERLPKIFPGNFNYFLAIVSTFFTYKKKQIKVTFGNETWEGKILNYVIANAKYFGNAIGIAPHADISSGSFAITNIGNISLWDYFKNIGKAKKCQKINHPEVHYSHLEKVFIENKDEMPLTFEMDGEFVGYAPVTLTVIPQKVYFLCKKSC